MAEIPKHTEFRVEPLGPGHERAGFACGVQPLDHYITTQATQDARNRVAVPFVLAPDGRIIAGYYTLSQYSVRLTSLPDAAARKLPKYPLVPATLIGRLAISKAFQGRGLGELLLKDALHRSLEGSKQIASFAIIVDTIDDKAAEFYKKYGFMVLPQVPRRLFLPTKTIEQMFS